MLTRKCGLCDIYCISFYWHKYIKKLCLHWYCIGRQGITCWQKQLHGYEVSHLLWQCFNVCSFGNIIIIVQAYNVGKSHYMIWKRPTKNPNKNHGAKEYVPEKEMKHSKSWHQIKTMGISEVPITFALIIG